jgi:hypothetical protein
MWRWYRMITPSDDTFVDLPLVGGEVGFRL